ncbi:hypothetical protein D9M68_678850 [compost metagenome]
MIAASKPVTCPLWPSASAVISTSTPSTVALPLTLIEPLASRLNWSAEATTGTTRLRAPTTEKLKSESVTVWLPRPAAICDMRSTWENRASSASPTSAIRILVRSSGSPRGRSPVSKSPPSASRLETAMRPVISANGSSAIEIERSFATGWPDAASLSATSRALSAIAPLAVTRTTVLPTSAR